MGESESQVSIASAVEGVGPVGIVWDQCYWESDLQVMLQMLGQGEELGMFEIDLDNFGTVNKSLDHAVGDEAIRIHCRLTKRIFEQVGEVYRRGGDELVVLAPGLNETSAREFAETARIKVAETFRDWALNTSWTNLQQRVSGSCLQTQRRRPPKLFNVLTKLKGRPKNKARIGWSSSHKLERETWGQERSQ
jgi:diguanylate cyclase (GGDEF)-like protein